MVLNLKNTHKFRSVHQCITKLICKNLSFCDINLLYPPKCRRPPKALPSFRPKRFPCALRMWTECSRITQKASLSGSPKVPSCIVLYQIRTCTASCKKLHIYVSYNTLICVPAGPVVALELNGDGVVEACRSIANEVFNETKVNIRGSYYSSYYWFLKSIYWGFALII